MAVVFALLSVPALSASAWLGVVRPVVRPAGVAFSPAVRTLSDDEAVLRCEISATAQDASDVSNLLLAFGVRRTDAHAIELPRRSLSPADFPPAWDETNVAHEARPVVASRARVVKPAAVAARRATRLQYARRSDERLVTHLSAGIERRPAESRREKAKTAERPERAEVSGEGERVTPPAAVAPAQCPSEALRARTRL